jgi:hypothetical protein
VPGPGQRRLQRPHPLGRSAGLRADPGELLLLPGGGRRRRGHGGVERIHLRLGGGRGGLRLGQLLRPLRGNGRRGGERGIERADLRRGLLRRGLGLGQRLGLPLRRLDGLVDGGGECPSLGLGPLPGGVGGVDRLLLPLQPGDLPGLHGERPDRIAELLRRLARGTKGLAEAARQRRADGDLDCLAASGAECHRGMPFSAGQACRGHVLRAQ